jgi:hypothetical protein
MPLRKKVSKTNSGSYVICLPCEWVYDFLTTHQQAELKEVLVDVDGALIIRPVQEDTEDL